MDDISIKEFRDRCREMCREMGPKASISTFVSEHGDELLCALVYPKGISGTRANMEFSERANSFLELINKLTRKWAEHSETYKQRTIRQMALAIIRITSELGECTDAALRNCGEFDPGQIARFGQQACADANEIAGRGPFSIITKGGANGTPEAA